MEPLLNWEGCVNVLRYLNFDQIEYANGDLTGTPDKLLYDVIGNPYGDNDPYGGENQVYNQNQVDHWIESMNALTQADADLLIGVCNGDSALPNVGSPGNPTRIVRPT